jgi:hypothetical protein
VTIVTGFIFIVCVLAFRKGIVGEILALAGKGQARDRTSVSLKFNFICRRQVTPG